MTRPTYDAYFMSLAHAAATMGTCSRRQVGAVAVREKRVLATGFNGSPAGTHHCEHEWYSSFRSIDELNLSVRSSNCLENANIKYLGELVQVTEASLLSHKNFGWKSLTEIKTKLQELNMDFRTRIVDWPKLLARWQADPVYRDDPDLITVNGRPSCSNAVHAEANVLAYAAADGVALRGATIYTNTYPCHGCMKQMVSCGIVEVVYDADYCNDPLVAKLCEESGVKLRRFVNNPSADSSD